MKTDHKRNYEFCRKLFFCVCVLIRVMFAGQLKLELVQLYSNIPPCSINSLGMSQGTCYTLFDSSHIISSVTQVLKIQPMSSIALTFPPPPPFLSSKPIELSDCVV
jgi:hypothetical protein